MTSSTATPDRHDAAGPDDAGAMLVAATVDPAVPERTCRQDPGVVTVDVPIGRRVMVVSDLLLTPEATPSSLSVSGELALVLDSWDGPGILVIAGNLFDLSGSGSPLEEGRRALGAHPRLRDAMRRFAAEDERRVIRQNGTHEPGYDTDPATVAALAALGVEQTGPVDLRLHTAAGVRFVRVEPGEQSYGPDGAGRPGGPDGAAASTDPSVATGVWKNLAGQDEADAPWLAGMRRLSDPSALPRFISSRTLYRRLGRYVWWLLVPFVVAGLLRFLIPSGAVPATGTGITARAIRNAYRADLADRFIGAAVVALVALVVMALVLGLLSRRMWSILGGGALQSVQSEAGVHDTARDAARRLVAQGYAGLITGATYHSELTNLALGFFANVGATAEVVEEHRSRLGLPPVFTSRLRVSWVEVETGADLHVRLLLAESDLASPSIIERLVARRRLVRSLHPSIVASYPHGDSWPPAPDLHQAYRHTRRVRRLTAAAILVAGVIDLIDAITPPARGRLHLLLEFLPLRATQAAGALVALAGLALIGLGRGILRGQRRAWQVAVVLLIGTLFLHLLAGVDVEESVLALVVLTILVVYRRDFRAASDWSSLRTAVLALIGGAVGITLLAAASIEFYARVGSRHHFHIAWWTAVWASAERLVGIQTIALPDRLDDFLAPSLLMVGLALAAVGLFLLTRPVVDRRLTSGRAGEFRARDIVRRHGASTLDYFALRSDKKWFFHRDSLVAYAVYGGICLVSPDPIGPRNEREQVWGAFRRFADSHGWIPAVMGAGDDWLPVYRETGMHNVYLGDEAVVDVQRFSLAGGDKKGLRQAHNRIQKKGYAATFHDPSRLDAAMTAELVGLMGLSRRGEHERGFSMMLGRVFDPRDVGLLLTVVRGPDGRPAAMCQFVPSAGINGYSLDLMRRDPGDHPNGLLDFALCSTIEHLREDGRQGLSLNFAALRSTVSGDKGDGAVQRAERWMLKKASSFAQIESLWRFNAKYDPEWLPRYVVFDTPEHLVPVVMAILRAESLWEIPVIGRLLAAGAEKRMIAAQQETAEAVAGFREDGAGSEG